jgi:long-chain fatty acid transport protein
MTSKFRIAPSSVVVFTVTFITASILLADGYRNPPEGARAIGAFGGHRAFADDANATIHNSANLVDLKQPMVQANTTFGYGTTTFERAGVSDKTENPFFAIPGFSAAVPFQEGKYALGLAAYIPYGRSVAWDRGDFFGQNNVSYAGSMMVADFTPNVAVRLTDSLSVGVGADIYYGEVEQKTILNAAAAPFYGVAANSKSTLTADGDAIGWNAATTWKMTKRQRLALTYRSPVDIVYHGDNKVDGAGTSDVSAQIEYPTIVGLAYGIEFTDTLRAEVDVEWLEFSTYQNLKIKDSRGGLWNSSTAQNLKDTWTAGIGAEWDFMPQWTFRSGFMYLQNPTPEKTYGPLGPDENQGVISFGLGYEIDHHSIDLGYAYGLFDGRNISGNNTAGHDGEYDYNVHLLALSYGYKF